jgi:DNA modification methylase
METSHQIIAGDARDLSDIEPSTVDLVVTSPPYPMIEVWDEFFMEQDSEIRSLFDEGKTSACFEQMHRFLDQVWEEINRVLAPSGLVCVNVGDATRKIKDVFKLFPNHVRITEWFTGEGFEQLPGIIWRKPTNSANKFMGSGMLPPNAYMTLEHEHILIFRKPKGPRDTRPKDPRRYESGYFWEERNRWFSDLWEGITGIVQDLDESGLRKRAAAFPLEIPYRLINMFSLRDDRVVDPFWGTGTTTLAAMMSGRNSVGIELNEAFLEYFENRVDDVRNMAEETNRMRYERHQDFVDSQKDDFFQYVNQPYDIPVKTKQEKQIQFVMPSKITQTECGYRVAHEPWTPER